jgi:hypothetical protein
MSMHWGSDVAGIEDDPCVLSLTIGILTGFYLPKLLLQFTASLVRFSVHWIESIEHWLLDRGGLICPSTGLQRLSTDLAWPFIRNRASSNQLFQGVAIRSTTVPIFTCQKWI